MKKIKNIEKSNPNKRLKISKKVCLAYFVCFGYVDFVCFIFILFSYGFGWFVQLKQSNVRDYVAFPQRHLTFLLNLSDI